MAEAADEESEHSEEDTEREDGETRAPAKYECDDGSTSSEEIVRDQDALVDMWQPAAPILIKDMVLMLSHYNWDRQDCVPQGVINILINTWHDLIEGVALQNAEPTEEQLENKPASKEESAPEGLRESEEGDGEGEGAARRPKKDKKKPGPSEKAKKRKGIRPMTFTFSLSSNRCKPSGWIIRPEQPNHDKLQQIMLYQWALERLQSARLKKEVSTKPTSQVILRHYGATKTKEKREKREKGARRKSRSPIMSGGIPRPPPVKKSGPPPKKLHYRINDGSSLIFYPSGRLAICRSHTAMSCDGYCTNVFNDSDCPVILATVTAFGHGSVTDADSALIAVWDQEGGFMNDNHGSKIKEWDWVTYCAVRETIVIELSDLMTLRLHSGIYIVLIFRYGTECVQLRLPVLPNADRPKEMPCLVTDEPLVSTFAKELLLVRKSRPVTHGTCKNRKIVKTHAPVGKQMEVVQEPPARWRKPGAPLRELKKIHLKVQQIVEEWMEVYRAAINIKLPGREPHAPQKPRTRREQASRPLGRSEAKHGRTDDDENGNLPLRPKPTDTDSQPTVHWTPLPEIDGDFQIVHVGPLRIHSSIQLGPVTILKRIESPTAEAPAATRSAPLAFLPLLPLTVCPKLLRSALREEKLPKQRCSCSCKKMPTLTDMDYDNFLMGQPPYSQQMLVVCVTHECERVGPLEHLYRRMNNNRRMPCTQCQMDSFRLLRYTMPEVRTPGSEEENKLLEQRHNAVPGMYLMYIRGTLLFVGYLNAKHRCSVADLHRQITKARTDYRLGQSLPADFKYSERTITPEIKALLSTMRAACDGANASLRDSSLEAKRSRRRCFEVSELPPLPPPPLPPPSAYQH